MQLVIVAVSMLRWQLLKQQKQPHVSLTW